MRLPVNAWFAIAALDGALAVIAGAFAAHGLRGQLSAAALEVFQTGARYQMYHALAMALAALVMRGESVARARLAAALFLIGSVLFCGSLYSLALSGLRGFGVVTPFGGLAFIGGWIALAAAGLKLKA